MLGFVPGLQHYLILGALLFSIGLFGALTRPNAVVVLMAIELMLNGVNVTLAGFARFLGSEAVIGQIFALFIITVAAAEAAVGLAIVIAIYRLRRTVEVNRVDVLKG